MRRRELDQRAQERRFALSVLTDAWLEGNRLYWEQRARQLIEARPKPGDFHGRATRAQLRARHDGLTAAAQACRQRALFDDVSQAELEEALHNIASSSRAVDDLELPDDGGPAA